MGLVIDTNIFIDAEHNSSSLEKLNDEKFGDAYIAAITMSELLMGVHLAKNIATRIKRSSFVENILAAIPVLDFDETVARSYAEIYAYFIKPRSKMGASVHDLQIAATALAYGFSVLTNNKSDFIKIPGIELVDI